METQEERKYPNLTVISTNLRLLRLIKGVSQDELSASINLSRSTYSGFESGKRAPDLYTLDALSVYHNMSIETIVSSNITTCLLKKVYLNKGTEELKILLKKYQSLSTISKGIIMERLQVLLERESAFYNSYSPHDSDTWL